MVLQHNRYKSASGMPACAFTLETYIPFLSCTVELSCGQVARSLVFL